MWELGAITVVKIMLGALDLLLAIFLYRFVLLLQGNAQASHISVFRTHLSFLNMALMVLVGFVLRMSGEVTVIRWTNTYRQNLYRSEEHRLNSSHQVQSRMPSSA